MNTYYIYLQFTLVEREKMNSVQMALSSGRNGSGRNETRKHDVYTIEVTSLYILYVGMAYIFRGGGKEHLSYFARCQPKKFLLTFVTGPPPLATNSTSPLVILFKKCRHFYVQTMTSWGWEGYNVSHNYGFLSI